jgi:hypothetical protein
MYQKNLNTILTGQYVDGIELQYYLILSNAIERCKNINDINKNKDNYYKEITNCVNKYHFITGSSFFIKIHYLHKETVKNIFLHLNLPYEKYCKNKVNKINPYTLNN